MEEKERWVTSWKENATPDFRHIVLRAHPRFFLSPPTRLTSPIMCHSLAAWPGSSKRRKDLAPGKIDQESTEVKRKLTSSKKSRIRATNDVTPCYPLPRPFHQLEFFTLFEFLQIPDELSTRVASKKHYHEILLSWSGAIRQNLPHQV